MSEYTILWIAFGSLIGLVISALLYAIGGRVGGPGKWIRRFVASFILATVVNMASVMMGNYSVWLILAYPGLVASFSLGYGADTLIFKVIRRLIYALGVILSGLIFCFVFGGMCWWVLPFHIGVGLFSVYLGIRNPVPAPVEELFICVLLNLGLVLYPFVPKS